VKHKLLNESRQH